MFLGVKEAAGHRAGRIFRSRRALQHGRRSEVPGGIHLNLGTHRFQRADSARGALRSNRPSPQDCTLEAMRTQGARDTVYKSERLCETLPALQDEVFTD